MDARDHLLDKRKRLYREYQNAIAPIVKHMGRTQGLMLPTIFVSDKGIERVYTPEQQKILDGYQALLDQAAESFGPQIQKLDQMLGFHAAYP